MIPYGSTDGYQPASQWWEQYVENADLRIIEKDDPELLLVEQDTFLNRALPCGGSDVKPPLTGPVSY